MTAVEELLRRAADVRRLFDEMLGPIPDLPNMGFVVDAAQALRRFCSRRREPETDALALDEIGFLVEPFYRHLFTPERWRLVCRWASNDAMLIAATRGVAEELNGRWDVCTLEHYLRFLEERERLLDPELLESLAREAVRESVSWGPDAPEARRRAEAVVGALRTLAEREMNTGERWQLERDSQLEPATRRLGRFAAQPIKVAKTEKAPPLRKTRKRKGGGGRPPKHNGALFRERREYEARMKRTKAKPQALDPWLKKWAKEHNQSFKAVRTRYNSERDRKGKQAKKTRRETAD
jgi:hypothetical protein